MKKARRIAAVGLVFVAGMTTMILIQATTASLLPIDFNGVVHPIYSLSTGVYLITTTVIGGFTALFYAE